MTLVELVVSFVLLTGGVLATASVITMGMHSVATSAVRDRATAEATRALEAARALPYAALAVPAATSGTARCTDPDGSGAMAAETLVTDAAAGQVSGLPYAGTSDGRTLATCVTWASDPRLSASQSAKRITVVVTWQSGTSTSEVRLSTIVDALARRAA